MMFGVPTLLKKSPKAAGISLLGSAAGKLVSAAIEFLFGKPKWGIYKAGTSDVGVEVSSVVELEITGESMVSDFPIQTGSFVSYNKVLQPNIFALRFTQDGFEAKRASLLKWCEDNVSSVVLFDVACPEKTWTNATLIRYRNLRSAEAGAGMVMVECIFQQIRDLPATYTSSKTKAPANAPVGPTARVNPVSAVAGAVVSKVKSVIGR